MLPEEGWRHLTPTLLHPGPVATKREPRILRLYSFGAVVLPEEDQQSPLLLFYQVSLNGTSASAPWHRLSLCLVVFVGPWLRSLLQLPLTGH